MLLIGIAAKAQDSRVTLNLNYNYSFPIGEFKSGLVSDHSPRGFTGNLMYQINPLIGVGLGVGYQDYYQKYPREVYNTGKNEQISAVLTNSLQTVPILARAELFPLATSQTKIAPYISVATGLNFVDYSQYLGQFATSDTRAGFRLQGGLGVRIPVLQGKGGFDVGGSYDYAPYKHFGLKDLNNVNVHGGLYIQLK